MKKNYILLFLFFISVQMFSQQNFLWAKNSGGTANEDLEQIVTDKDSNSYITGSFSGSVSFGSFNVTSIGGTDIYVAKIDSEGNYLWVKTFGSIDDDQGDAIVLDGNGNFFVTGSFGGDISIGNTNLFSDVQAETFISKFDENGNALWTKQTYTNDINGNENCVSYNITSDLSGNCYVSGSFTGSTLIGNVRISTTSDQPNAFVTKLDSNGNFIWTKPVIGTSYNFFFDMKTDNMGNNYLTGEGSGIITFGNIVFNDATLQEIAYVTKIDTNGNFVWAQLAKSNFESYGNRIALDKVGNIYFTGAFYGTTTFGNDTYTSASFGTGYLKNAYISKLDQNGNYIWTKNIGGNGTTNSGIDLSIADNGEIYFMGLFGASDVDFFRRNVYISKIDKTGNNFLWKKDISGTMDNHQSYFTVDSNKNIFIGGMFQGTIGLDNNSLTSNGGTDIYLSKLNDVSLAVKETDKANVEIYPNPVSETLRFQSDSAIEFVTLADSSGRIVLSKEGLNLKELNVNHLIKGIYILELKTKNKLISKKIIKL